ncbi:vacuolar protein sorting-associated protein 18 [Anaeramoeba flamelloides]|uniref:Vacuolar protein sorting-associated protein 18 n=1 Tax=Anaeramoeba flamelloides TaxID=1746091 RepID=A0AAV8A6J6_9EUKA|nr:vacuolar protein sorting-associated protein 18 [Anaeramoeba flamelloides]
MQSQRLYSWVKPIDPPTYFEHSEYKLLTLSREHLELDKNNKQTPKKPIFNFQKLFYKSKTEIRSVQSANNIVVIAETRGPIKWIDLNNVSLVNEIIIDKKNERVSVRKLFLDPSGNHVIVSLKNKTNYYLCLSKQKSIMLKISERRIESVCWYPQVTQKKSTPTNYILAGTNKGEFYKISFLQRYNIQIDLLFKTINLEIRKEVPITSIFYQRYQKQQDKTLVIFSTSGSLHNFICDNNFETVNEIKRHYRPVKSFKSSKRKSKLSIFLNKNILDIAWMNSKCLFTGQAKLKKPQKRKKEIIKQQKNELYPIDTTSKNNYRPVPITFTNTKHHYIYLFPNRFLAIQKLVPNIVYDDPSFLNEFLGLSYDKPNNRIWLYSRTEITEVILVNEERDLWQSYLEKKNFQSSLDYCKTNHQRNIVSIELAEHLYSNKEYLKSAKIYAKTDQEFEKISLKFLDLKEHEYLLVYLKEKLRILNPQEKIQRTMIASWLIEIYLQLMFEQKQKNKYFQSPNSSDLYHELQDGLNNHIGYCKDESLFSQNILIKLLGSYTLFNDFMTHSQEIVDTEKGILNYIQSNKFEQALQALIKSKRPKIFYQHFEICMKNVPCATIHALQTYGNLIEPKKLLPTFWRYSINQNEKKNNKHQAIEYLEFCLEVLTNRELIVHHFLLSLYSKNDYQDKFCNYLNNPNYKNCYRKKFALDLCIKYKLTKPTVYLYSELQLYEKAVDLALSFDIEWARIATDACKDPERKKKLSQTITKFLIKNSNNTTNTNQPRDIESILQFLDFCEILDLETVLPLFPDSKLVDTIKSYVVNSLNKKHKRIGELKTKMKNSIKNSKSIKKDLQNFRNNRIIIKPTYNCQICGKNILGQDFIIFPCEHIFHKKCLESELISKYLTKTEIKRVERDRDLIQRAKSGDYDAQVKLIKRCNYIDDDDYENTNKNKNNNNKFNNNNNKKKKKKKNNKNDDNNDQDDQNLSSNSSISEDWEKITKNEINLQKNQNQDGNKNILQINQKKLNDIINLYQQKLNKILYGNCLRCGEILIQIIQKDFVDRESKQEIIEERSWEIPITPINWNKKIEMKKN